MTIKAAKPATPYPPTPKNRLPLSQDKIAELLREIVQRILVVSDPEQIILLSLCSIFYSIHSTIVATPWPTPTHNVTRP